MIKNLYATSLLIMIAISVIGQVQRNTGQITGGIYSAASIETFSAAVSVNPDDNFLYKEWLFGSVDLKHTEHLDIKQIPLRYNVVNNELEIKVDEKTKIISLDLVKEFSVLLPGQAPNKFVHGKDGIVEEIHAGEHFSTFIRYDYSVQPPDYNAQFDTGSKVEKIIIKERFFLKNHSNGELNDFKMRTNSFVKAFKKMDPEVYKKLKNEKFVIDDKSSLAKATLLSNDLK